MLDALKNENIDIEGAVKNLQRFAPNVDAEIIKKLLNEINKVKDKRSHVIYKDLTSSKTKVEKDKEAPERTLTKHVTQV